MSRRCCCLTGCIIYQDAFDRGDSTDLTAKWFEAVGNSEIVSQELVMPAGARVVCTVKNPQNVPNSSVNAVLKNPQNGKKIHVFLNSDDDGDNYVGAELECGATTATIRTVSTTAGVSTTGDENTFIYTPGNDLAVGACRTVEGLSVGSGPSLLTWDCLAWNGYRKSGISNEGAGQIEVDDFLYARQFAKNEECVICECQCEGKCMPKVLNLVFGASGSCSCLGGICITLTFDPSKQPLMAWSGSATLCDWPGTGTNLWEFTLYCDPSQGDGRFILCVKNIDSTACDVNTWTTPIGDCDNVTEEGAAPISISCDPFELAYGPFICTGTPPDPPECGYSIVITAGAC